MAQPTSNASVLRKARETLTTAQRGLAALFGDDPTARHAGIYNVAVFGRSVTLVLQNLRSIDRVGFNAWYAPFEAEMKADPLLRYFRDLRNEILKEGPPDVVMATHVESLSGADIARLQADPPPGALKFFIGDRLGGSGWKVRMPDGSSEKYYVALPPDLSMKISLHLPDPPTEHRGKLLPDTSVEAPSQLYVGYLTAVIESAEAHFGT